MEEIRFLADVNVEKPIVDYIVQQGYDIKWIPDYQCAMTDETLLDLARTESRILITNDKDFGELVFLQKRLHAGVILFRVKGQTSAYKVRLFKKLLMGYKNKLLNHFTVVTKTKLRFALMEGEQT